ncbi:MAG: hypothetical protein BMS9Abin26_1065 [Gammaproteobacteria bacterium]|nr:MAG: hypothetical protein BMS9Abin26_1065 [Gammaproteobacteria bacterium]
MKLFTQFAVMLFSLLLLTGCETLGGKGDADKDSEAQVEDRSTSSASTSGTGSGSEFQGDPLDDPGSVLATRMVYFEFDSSTITPESRAVITAHARYLASNPGVSIVLEGHADERGTREYNVALGEQRANSVRQLMSLSGVSGNQMQTVSYGEERPASSAHDESGWQLNRRVELVYQR